MTDYIRTIYILDNYDLTPFIFDWPRIQRDSPNSIILGYFRNNVLAGLVAFEHRLKPTDLYNFVLDIEVRTDSQHQRIATKLLAQVMLDAFHQPNIEGYVVLNSKTKTRNFYQSLGGYFIDYERVIFRPEVSQAIIEQFLPRGGLLFD